MKPTNINNLILQLIIVGLFFTYGCGSSKSSDGVTAGNTDGVTITNEVSTPADMSVGDIIMSQFSTVEPAAFDFSGVESTSQYYLVVGSLGYSYGSYNVRIESSIDALGSDNLIEAFSEDSDEDNEQWDSWTAADAFNQRLHDVGLVLALDPEVEVAGVKYSVGVKSNSVDEAISVGDTEEFRVLDSLTSMTSYETVNAKARCVKDNIIFYVDTEVEETNPEDLTSDDIQTLCDNFNDQVALERTWYGSESDVNSDGKVAVLLTPQVNRLGAMGGGIITGFFYAADLYARSGSNPVSNSREIIYALVPDSEGAYGTVIPKTFGIDNLLTAVLPHELQHVISYNMHVFEGSGVPEENWLNEGMSHLTEDLVGYGQENYSRISIYLSNPAYYRLVTSSSPGLGERGGSYLFMRFLYEQHSNPTDFLWQLYHSGSTGVANVEVSYAGTSDDFDQFGEFFMRWMTAIAMTNRGLSQDTKYVYETRTYNSETERWQGMCMVCETGDGRGTVLTGPSMQTYSGATSFSIYSSAMRVYDVSTVPEEITLTGASNGTFGAVLIRKQ